MQPTEINPTCIVLGGHGFVGSAVVAEALRRGYTTHAVGRQEYASMVGTPCDLLVNANGNSRKYIAREDPALDFDLSVRSVLHSLRDFQCQKYVYLSSIDIYDNVTDPEANRETATIHPDRLSRYGFHKHLAEELVRYEAPGWLILRMGGFVGPGLWKNPLFDLLNGIPLRVHPDSAYQYLHTSDLARILFDLVEIGHEKEIYNVVGRDVLTLRDAAEMIPGILLNEQPEHKVERYEVNLDRISELFPIPETRATVWRFLSDVLQGRVRLGKAAP